MKLEIEDPELTSLTVEYELTLEDLIEGGMASLKRSRTIRRYVLVSLLLGVPATAFGILGVKSLIDTNKGNNVYDLILYSILALILMALITPWYLRGYYRGLFAAHYREGLNRRLVGRYRITLNEHGVQDESDVHDGLTKWWGVVDITEGDKALYILAVGGAAHIIPRRAFPDADAFNRFADTARRLHAAVTNSPPPRPSAPPSPP